MVTVAVAARLLLVAIRVLQGVVSEIQKQAKAVENVVSTITNTILPGTQTWEGEDADAFRAEVQSRLLPQIAALLAAILGMNMGIEHALTTVEQADTKCVSYADDLAEKFRAIY